MCSHAFCSSASCCCCSPKEKEQCETTLEESEPSCIGNIPSAPPCVPNIVTANLTKSVGTPDNTYNSDTCYDCRSVTRGSRTSFSTSRTKTSSNCCCVTGLSDICSQSVHTSSSAAMLCCGSHGAAKNPSEDNCQDDSKSTWSQSHSAGMYERGGLKQNG